MTRTTTPERGTFPGTAPDPFDPTDPRNVPPMGRKSCAVRGVVPVADLSAPIQPVAVASSRAWLEPVTLYPFARPTLCEDICFTVVVESFDTFALVRFPAEGEDTKQYVVVFNTKTEADNWIAANCPNRHGAADVRGFATSLFELRVTGRYAGYWKPTSASAALPADAAEVVAWEGGAK